MSAEHQQRVDEHFQSHANRWREFYEESSIEGEIYQRRLAMVLGWVDELGRPAGERVLEIGCGAGVTAVALAQRGLLVEAMDSTAAMVCATRERAAGAGVSPSLACRLGDAHRLAFGDGAFGLALAIGVVPYLHSPEIALKEMARVLKPGGMLLVTAGNRSRLDHLLDPWLSPPLQPAKKVVRTILLRRQRPVESPPPRLRLGSLRELDGWLASAGLTRVRTKAVGFLPLTFHYRRVLGEGSSIRLNRWLQWLADRDLPGVRSSGMDYLVLASKADAPRAERS